VVLLGKKGIAPGRAAPSPQFVWPWDCRGETVDNRGRKPGDRRPEKTTSCRAPGKEVSFEPLERCPTSFGGELRFWILEDERTGKGEEREKKQTVTKTPMNGTRSLIFAQEATSDKESRQKESDLDTGQGHWLMPIPQSANNTLGLVKVVHGHQARCRQRTTKGNHSGSRLADLFCF